MVIAKGLNLVYLIIIRLLINKLVKNQDIYEILVFFCFSSFKTIHYLLLITYCIGGVCECRIP